MLILIRGKALLVGDSADMGVLTVVAGCNLGLVGFVPDGDEETKLAREPAGLECRWTSVDWRLLVGSAPPFEVTGEGELLIL